MIYDNPARVQTEHTARSTMGSYVVFFDLETQNKIEDQVGRFREDRTRNLSVSCGCSLRVDSDLILQGKEEQALSQAVASTYWIDGADGMEGLLEEFDGAELIVSYNGLQFDHLVLSQYYENDRGRELSHTFKAHDVFRRIIDSQSRRWPKLDKLLLLNGFAPKTANGLVAIQWWASGNRRDLEAYCKSDVLLMAKLALKRDGIELDGGEPLKAPSSLVGVAPALAARRFSLAAKSAKRRRDADHADSAN